MSTDPLAPPPPLTITGTGAEIYSLIKDVLPEVPTVLAHARSLVPHNKRQIEEYQAAFLYEVTHHYNREGARILELGTATGYSSAIMAQACPLAGIITLNPQEHEVEQARKNLAGFGNVKVFPERSWDYLERLRQKGMPLHDVIFVDGDHARIRRDLPWFECLRMGGLFLFHDYSPETSTRPCPPVYDALNAMQKALRRPFDVSCVDVSGVGMVGFYNRGSADAEWWDRLPPEYRTR